MNEALVHKYFGSSPSFVSQPPHELADRLLQFLKAWGAPSFHPRNTVSAVLQFFLASSNLVAEAIYTAWNELVRENYLIPDHRSLSGDWFVLSSKAQAADSFTPTRQVTSGSEIGAGNRKREEQPDAAESELERRKTVMVVYGRNTALKDAMFKFLEAVGLKPVEWEEGVKRAGIATPYPGQVLDAIFNSARALVVLLSGDDDAKLRGEFLTESDGDSERVLTPQARPNVIFEAGMAFGRHPNQTIIVEVGTLRPFSDIVGRHVVRFDGTKQKREQLVNRLKTAGSDLALVGDNHLTIDLGYEFRDHKPQARLQASPRKSVDPNSVLKALEKELSDNARRLRYKTGLGETVGPYFNPVNYDLGFENLSVAKWETFQHSPAVHELDPVLTALLAEAGGQVRNMIELEGRYREMEPLSTTGQKARYHLRDSSGPALAAVEDALKAVRSSLNQSD